MQKRKKKDTDLQNSLLDSMGEGEGGMFQENSIETCMLSRVKQITSPGWMHETSARTWCTGKTQRKRVEMEVGGGISTHSKALAQSMKQKQMIFLEFSCLFYDPVKVGNLISGPSAFSESSLYIWKFLGHILLKPSWRILSITLLLDEMRSAILRQFEYIWHYLSLVLE